MRRMLFLMFAAATAARVMDSLAAVPHGWEEVRRPSSTDAIVLRVALKQQRSAALEQAVLEMSTPGNPNYGMHMTRDEVRSYTAPSQASTAAVTQWLSAHGIEPRVDNDWVSFTTTTGVASELLNTTFAWYKYEGGGGDKLRTLSYSVPDHIVAHIDLVQPTTRFGRLGAKRSSIFDIHRVGDATAADAIATKGAFIAADNSNDAVQCGSMVTPACLKSLYNINYTASASNENKVAFCSYLEEYARYRDLELFTEKYVPQAKGQNFSVELVNGGLNDQNSRSDSSKLQPPSH